MLALGQQRDQAIDHAIRLTFPATVAGFLNRIGIKSRGNRKSPVCPSATMGDVPLTLVLGPANSAKAGEVLGEFAAESTRGAILVVPTAADADHYSRELAQGGAVLGSVLTFSGLAFEIAARAGYSARRLTKLQRERVLERALAATDLQALRDAATTKGFPTAAGELIAELERSLITPQRFAAAMRTWAQEDPRRDAYGVTWPRSTRRTRPRSTTWTASTPSFTPGGRSTRCGAVPACGAPNRCSSTASTICTRSSATRLKPLRVSSAPRSRSR